MNLFSGTFEHTPEEQSLLELYGTVRLFEKQCDKLKEEEAKAKLRARQEKFRRDQDQSGTDIQVDVTGSEPSPSSSNERISKKPKLVSSMDISESDDNMSDGGADDDLPIGENEEMLQQKEIQRLEKQQNEEEQKEKERQERDRHLEEGNNINDSGFVVTKKDRPGTYTRADLLGSVTSQSTPIHEFSKKFNLPRVGLAGSQVFPENTSQSPINESKWIPPSTASTPTDGDLRIELPDFDASSNSSISNGNNTLAIKFTAPQESSRFSLNVTTYTGHNEFSNILFHFNPRQRQRGGQLVVNDKQDGVWGQGVNVPLAILPLIFGETACTLFIQIGPDGFDIFIEDTHCARLEHRTSLPSKKCSLLLQFPSTDDYGNPENWTVYKVWWGNRPSMANVDLSHVAGVKSFNATHPKKLFVSNLHKIFTEAEVDLRRAQLERAFYKYGGAQGANVTVPTNSTFAFVELESERSTDLALKEMQGRYNISKARKSKAEIIAEQRAAADNGVAETRNESSTQWD